MSSHLRGFLVAITVDLRIILQLALAATKGSAELRPRSAPTGARQRSAPALGGVGCSAGCSASTRPRVLGQRVGAWGWGQCWCRRSLVCPGNDCHLSLLKQGRGCGSRRDGAGLHPSSVLLLSEHLLSFDIPETTISPC